MLRLYDNDQDVLVPACLLTPAEAQRHAHDLSDREVREELTHEAFIALCGLRRLVVRVAKRPPAPRMPSALAFDTR